jgi:hypothetical protein
MGSFKQGPLGMPYGKVGNIIISSWKGVPYVKSLPSERKSPLTEKEIANRRKWAMAHAWLQPVTEFVRAGFKGYSERAEGFVAAKSYLLKNAFEGTAPNFTINPALVKVSYGPLALPDSITVQKVNDRKLQFSWDTAHLTGAKNDQVMLLAYNLEKQYSFYKLPGALRISGKDSISLRALEGLHHLYAAFVAADRSCQSDSMYLGTVEI